MISTAQYYAHELDVGWTALARGGMRTITALPEPTQPGWVRLEFADGLVVEWPHTRDVTALPPT